MTIVNRRHSFNNFSGQNKTVFTFEFDCLKNNNKLEKFTSYDFG